MTAPAPHPARRGLSLTWLLLALNALVLVVPGLAYLGLRLFESQLVRQTESKLIGEAVVLAETWREFWLEAQGVPSAQAPSIRPLDASDERFYPIEPRLDAGAPRLPPVEAPTEFCPEGDGPAWQAGRRLQPILERAKAFNLTAARVVDAQGCTVATSGLWSGARLGGLPEVRRALSGSYASVTRARLSDEPKPALGSISSRGEVRLFVALPIVSGGQVVGAVWASRTSLDPLKAAWLLRRPVALALGLSALLTAAFSLLMAGLFTRPLRRLTAAAQAIARGEPGPALEPGRLAPAEFHRLGTALASMTRQLSERADYIAGFATNVSHELKTPIASIRGAAELLRDEPDMPPEQRARFHGNVLAAAQRMERLVARLLELARIQTAPEAAQDIALEPFLARLLQGYSGRVVLAPGAAPGPLRMNPDHLESALRNLLDNAARHGAGQPVELSVARRGARLAFAVRDHGPGISEANRRRLFERFFTTERDRGGTGLGLSIVRAVAETRGGEVDVETGPGGTTFTLVV
ncbi:MAG TPA: ATP-binding protein [Myxococcota bacterium]|nr:ATP-binding protein [Myxococcota bacterium]HRY93798.1 ATP-binding protein [Myxococcota bacterium]HSA20460.1 ATP-binding protein [Myxococcota bacterium]